MEDKCNALRTLALYARTLRLAYAPLLQRTLELMLPALSYLLYNGTYPYWLYSYTFVLFLYKLHFCNWILYVRELSDRYPRDCCRLARATVTREPQPDAGRRRVTDSLVSNPNSSLSCDASGDWGWDAGAAIYCFSRGADFTDLVLLCILYLYRDQWCCSSAPFINFVIYYIYSYIGIYIYNLLYIYINFIYTLTFQCIAELLDLDYMVARGDENADGHILTADDYTQLNLVFNKGFKMLTQLNQEFAGNLNKCFSLSRYCRLLNYTCTDVTFIGQSAFNWDLILYLLMPVHSTVIVL